MSDHQPPITLTAVQADQIVGALLDGCLTLTLERLASKDSSGGALGQTHDRLRDAMLLLEGRIAQTAPPAAPSEPEPLHAYD